MPIYKLINQQGKLDSVIVRCLCHSTEHELTITRIDWDDEVNYSICVHLASYHGLWSRLKHAIKYVFGHRSNYGDFDEILIREADVESLLRIWSKQDEL